MTPEYIRNLPRLPGIYVFKDKNSGIIYIGKAKSLKNRVLSYFRRQTEDWKVQELIKEHALVEYILTKNEIEALLLEAQLIRTYKPKYNVLLKNTNPFVYMLITQKEMPELKLVRNKKEKGTYFGPFLYKQKARSVYEYLMRTLRLRLCSTKIEQGCLDYHMGLCAGNCVASFNPVDYKVRLQLAQSLLEGNHAACESLLTSQIKEHNHRMEFEKSKNLSSYLGDLEIIFETLKTGFSETKYVKDITVMMTPISAKIEKPLQALKELKDLLSLPHSIESIDCFDISHFQSSYLVGSCVRFTHGMPNKNKFRRFKIKTLTEQNDYAALQEIVSRRYRNPEELPDVVLIDGGKGQLNAVKDLFPKTMFISLAKKEELLFTPYHTEGVHLDIKTALGQLLIALRDYAHHFAVSYHKVLRSKNLIL
jgi:excinuclease ABC subunit C